MEFFKSCVDFLLRLSTFSPPAGLPILQNPESTPKDIEPGPKLVHSTDYPDPQDDETAWPVGKPFDYCRYPKMSGWQNCSDPYDRACWLKRDDGWGQFDLNTDFDYDWPTGILRKFEINVTNAIISPDGFEKIHATVINDQYPEPLIEACWGDMIEVRVKNYVETNGTTIHWHGVRQFETSQMDEVNVKFI
ncbi:hypothetical protein MMC12_005623, partial [Toensbergia leucococca]|nr:hypothetical protein [Toensbergia leucococca]